ncbi:uncharacterized protein LOC122025075 [Zingiber officinale]|uniref:Uncharacterized protein n=1 Tax=Zingiber officinale TaxID=94328 RepID=A0A8J5EY86_ZINOF|nr:uncharacterized protein LOC122025075 [Zingiber officinale]KAG6477131.1 hypothetical protein ZIOFF_066383 [Zingiber officinale]
MGNCIDLEKKKKMVRIMRMDGQILHYQPPLKVQQVLNEFPGHSISDTLPAIAYLDPAMFMRKGRLYYLLPSKNQIMETGDAVGVVRVKLVITKQQLKDMLSKGGITPHDMLSNLLREQSRKHSATEWRPSLESIPEGNDFY